MSELFNRKEEVIEFKLTQLGRRKFNSGTLNPVYYSFGDHDILYDSKFAGFSSSQNQASDQVTASIRPKQFGLPSLNLDNNKTFKTDFLGPSVLGSNEFGSEYLPAFELKLHNGHFTGTATFSTSTFLNQKTPTLEVKIDCPFNTSTLLFENPEYLLLEIKELNGLFEKENFEFRVFKRKNITLLNLSATTKIEQSLSFMPEGNFEEDMFNGDPSTLNFQQISLSPELIEFWFRIELDEKIENIINFETSKDGIYLNPNNNEAVNNC